MATRSSIAWRMPRTPWDLKELQMTEQLTPLLFSVQFSHSVVSNSLPPTLCTAGLPVHHQLLELTQTHVHRVGEAIQLPHPL